MGPTCKLCLKSLCTGPGGAGLASAMLTAMPGKSQGAAGASGCPWQRGCAAAISAAPRPSEEETPGEMAFGLEEYLCATLRDKLRLE